MKLGILFLFTTFCSVLFAQCDSIFPLNQAVLKYASSKMNKKVGTGECWDLAKFALENAGANWDGEYVYGRKLSSSECILPGDIIQFEKIKIKYKKGKQTFTETMMHHTAIVFATKNSDEVTLIHQNTDFSGKKVGTSKLVFSTITSGKYFIYRPEN